jgi:hypothetical protein
MVYLVLCGIITFTHTSEHSIVLSYLHPLAKMYHVITQFGVDGSEEKKQSFDTKKEAQVAALTDLVRIIRSLQTRGHGKFDDIHRIEAALRDDDGEIGVLASSMSEFGWWLSIAGIEDHFVISGKNNTGTTIPLLYLIVPFFAFLFFFQMHTTSNG